VGRVRDVLTALGASAGLQQLLGLGDPLADVRQVGLELGDPLAGGRALLAQPVALGGGRAAVDVGIGRLEPPAEVVRLRVQLRERVGPPLGVGLGLVGRRRQLVGALCRGLGPLGELLGLLREPVRPGLGRVRVGPALAQPVPQRPGPVVELAAAGLDCGGGRLVEPGLGRPSVDRLAAVGDRLARVGDLPGQLLAARLHLADLRLESLDLLGDRLQLLAARLVLLEDALGLVAGLDCGLALRLVVVDPLVELREPALELGEALVEVAVLLRLDLSVELRERTPLVAEDVLDAEPGLARPLPVGLEPAELEEVVDHLPPPGRRGVDQLVHLPLPDVRAVDERLGIHPEEVGHERPHVGRAVERHVRALEGTVVVDPVVVPGQAPADPVGFAVVGELKLDLAFRLPLGDDVSEGGLERARAVQREEARLQERRLPAAVEAVDHRDSRREVEADVAVRLEVPQPEAVEDHRNSSTDAWPSPASES